MKKKILGMILAGAMIISLTACGEDPDAKKYALIANTTTEEKQEYTQKAWEGLEKFAKEQESKYARYEPGGEQKDNYGDAIEEAIDAGAKVIVCIGEEMAVPVYQAQKDHKKTKFLLLEAQPHKKKSEEAVIKSNTCVIYFDEVQSGFLAGYASVAEGARNIGYMGGQENDRNKKLLSGFVQGAEAAAKDLSLGTGAVQLRYVYTGDNKLSPAHMGTALDWYKAGCEIIFTPDKEVGLSVMKAAENQNKKVIGADADRSGQSASVLTSTVKDYAGAVYHGLTESIGENFPGEKKVVYGAAENGVALTFDTGTFTAFDQSKYENMYRKLSTGDTAVTEEMPAGNLVTVTKE